MTTSVNDVKSKLIALIERAEADQAALVALLSDTEKAAIGQANHWTVKDQIAHVTFWRKHTLRLLIAVRDNTARPEPIADEQQANEQTFANHQHTAWDEVIAESDQVFREAKQVIAQLTDAQLTEVVGTGTVDVRLYERVASDYMEHPAEHLAQVYRESGDTARADAQEQATAHVYSELFSKDSRLYAYAVYNLGCFYARRGEAAQAIAAVGEALSLASTLVERSKEDPDLDSLRDMPAFEALYSR
jgi:hypothetical protein